MSDEKTINSIASHQEIINELRLVKARVQEDSSDKIRFKIETCHWYGYGEPFRIKSKDKFNLSKTSINLILDEAIKQEKEKINQLIDIEIYKRMKERNNE